MPIGSPRCDGASGLPIGVILNVVHRPSALTKFPVKLGSTNSNITFLPVPSMYRYSHTSYVADSCSGSEVRPLFVR
jgi:hypothetical protein